MFESDSNFWYVVSSIILAGVYHYRTLMHDKETNDKETNDKETNDKLSHAEYDELYEKMTKGKLYQNRTLS